MTGDPVEARDVHPEWGYGQDAEGHDLPAPDPIIRLIEETMRHHLPAKSPEGWVLCLEREPTRSITWRGPVYHRWHIAEEIKAALSEHGFTVVRTDPATVQEAAGAMAKQIHDRRWGDTMQSPKMIPDDYIAASQALACALAVLRGDPQ